MNTNTEALKMIDEAIARLQGEVSQLEQALEAAILEDSFAITMTDDAEPGAVRIYGEWKGRGKGFADLRTIPWHICGTHGFYQDKAKRQADKCNQAEKQPGVRYGYIHFRTLREHVLAELRRSLESITKTRGQLATA